MTVPNVRLTRRVTFSAGHRYWDAARSVEENRALFGAWASPYNHGHNYVLELTIEGKVDPASGMVVNIKDLDDRLRELIVSRLDGRSLNDEVDAFRIQPPSVENILRFVWQTYEKETPLANSKLVRAKLLETETLYGEIELSTEGLVTSITRTYEFAAAHRLHSDALSQEQNLDLYGKCNNPSGHGHNFVLEVTVRGEPDERTGMIADIAAIDRAVDEEVVLRYDHKHLNVDIPEFKDRVVTSEVLVDEIFSRLKDKLPAALWRVRLYETARSAFEVTAQA